MSLATESPAMESNEDGANDVPSMKQEEEPSVATPEVTQEPESDDPKPSEQPSPPSSDAQDIASSKDSPPASTGAQDEEDKDDLGFGAPMGGRGEVVRIGEPEPNATQPVENEAVAIDEKEAFVIDDTEELVDDTLEDEVVDASAVSEQAEDTSSGLATTTPTNNRLAGVRNSFLKAKSNIATATSTAAAKASPHLSSAAQKTRNFFASRFQKQSTSDAGTEDDGPAVVDDDNGASTLDAEI